MLFTFSFTPCAAHERNATARADRGAAPGLLDIATGLHRRRRGRPRPVLNCGAPEIGRGGARGGRRRAMPVGHLRAPPDQPRALRVDAAPIARKQLNDLVVVAAAANHLVHARPRFGDRHPAGARRRAQPQRARRGARRCGTLRDGRRAGGRRTRRAPRWWRRFRRRREPSRPSPRRARAVVVEALVACRRTACRGGVLPARASRCCSWSVDGRRAGGRRAVVVWQLAAPRGRRGLEGELRTAPSAGRRRTAAESEQERSNLQPRRPRLAARLAQVMAPSCPRAPPLLVRVSA